MDCRLTVDKLHRTSAWLGLAPSHVAQCLSSLLFDRLAQSCAAVLQGPLSLVNHVLGTSWASVCAVGRSPWLVVTRADVPGRAHVRRHQRMADPVC